MDYQENLIPVHHEIKSRNSSKNRNMIPSKERRCSRSSDVRTTKAVGEVSKVRKNTQYKKVIREEAETRRSSGTKVIRTLREQELKPS